MRYLILTDIHANAPALDACLANARVRGYDATLVLGDVVEYGADPNEVIDRVTALKPVAIVRGNHDKVACGAGASRGFQHGRQERRRVDLGDADARAPRWLAALPEGPCEVDDLIEICHGSPFDEDVLFDELDALRALKVATRPLCLFGHTHFPITFEQAPGSVEVIGASETREATIPLRADAKYLLNPGAVGQPRDGDPRAAYAIVDVERRQVELCRVRYPVEQAQATIMEAGLPEVLAARLAVGR